MTWQMPDSFPDLSTAKKIAVDIETRDDDLLSSGPGVRRDGYIIGVAIGTNDGFRKYYPIAHDEGPNLNKKKVFSWLSQELSRTNQTKVGANLLYDFDYLIHAGVKINGPIHDVQIAEPLIDENKQGRYSLDDLAKLYLKEEKKLSLVEEECRNRKLKGVPQKHLWKLPAEIVGPYAEGDVDLPLRIAPLQQKIIRQENLEVVHEMECNLLPLLLRMRQTGVRLDQTKLDQTISTYSKKRKEAIKFITKLGGSDVEPWAAESLAKAFDKIGIDYPLTPKTKKPSFTKGWLELNDHPFCKAIVEWRTIDKFIETFLIGQMRSQMIDDRIHCMFNQLKADENGTTTGRFSSSHPNLQFIPARDPIMGPLCRSMFIPEDGCDWGKADYSQVEFRIFAHYSMGDGAEDFRQSYLDNPRIDYHQWCADVAHISRTKAKTTNFGLIYGMGVAKLALQLGIPVEEAVEFLSHYHNRLPFIKHTLRQVSQKAMQRGWIKTILGRRRRFDYWEPADWELSKKLPGVRNRELMLEIVQEYIKECRKNKLPVPTFGVRRAATHKALNALIQGSAADLMKKAMVDLDKAGIFNVLTPHLTVHDELDVSKPRTKAGDKAWKEMINIMENSIKFKVPIVVDGAIGKDWGSTK